jgi:Short C-terminal domain
VVRARSEFDDYIRSTAGSGTSSADELARLADLRDKGTITEAEFQTMKARVVGGSGTDTMTGTTTASTTGASTDTPTG